jgi:hypothetical protein
MCVEVSKLRFYRKLMIPHKRPDPDISVLSMAMEMHCQPRDNDARPVTETYTLAKKASLDAEQNNIALLGILQALLLIALYKVRHAIYPAAYLTVGHCARLRYTIGIHTRKGGLQMFSKPGTAIPRQLVT